MKKMLSIFLAVLIVVTAMPFTALSVLGASDDEYTYTVDETMTAITIDKYNGNDKVVSVPSVIDGYTVKSIGIDSFRNNQTIEKVTIPDTVTFIGAFAFSGCQNLCDIVIPDTITSVDNHAFDGTVPENNFQLSNEEILYIGNYLIKAKATVSNIEIKEGTKGIAHYAMYQCKSLTSVIVPDGVVSIGNYAFANCESLVSISLPDSLRRIGLAAFSGTAYYKDKANWCNSNNMYEINGENNNLYIGKHLVKCGETSLNHYIVKNGTRCIGDYAFYGSALSEITLPISLNSVGNTAFENCKSLTDIYYKGKATQWDKVDGSIPEGIILHFMGGNDKPIVIEGAALSISSADAMIGDTITLPVTLEKVELGTLAYTITYDSSKLKFVSIDDIAFDMYDTNTVTDGKIVVVATNNVDASTGIIANVTFEVIASEDCTVDINVVIDEAYNGDDVAVEIGTVNGIVSVELYVLGDATGDGELTTLDARYVLQVAAGNRVLSEKEAKAADVNGDGKVSAIDARWILQAVAGSRVL